jgi:kynurenine formamidase
MNVSIKPVRRAALLGVALLALGGPPGTAREAQAPVDLWRVYDTAFVGAKYIDLTHAFGPDTPLGDDFSPLRFMTAHAAHGDGPGGEGVAFDYPTVGAAITGYVLPTDQVGTQLDPPAHGNAHGATISEFPPTMAVRPLVVIDMSARTRADPGAVATMTDIRKWEARYGRIPAGSVVMFRTDWSKRWSDAKAFKASPFPGIALPVLQFLHLQRHILFHGHEPYNTDMSPTFEAEKWLFEHDFAQAEGVANLDQVPERGALIAIGFAKPEGGSGGFARFVAIAPANWKYGVTIENMPGAPLPRHAKPLHRDAQGVLRVDP